MAEFKKAKHSNAGFVVMDALISLPILLFLVVSLGLMISFFLKHAFHTYANIELRYEMDSAFLRMVDDSNSSILIAPYPFAQGIQIAHLESPSRYKLTKKEQPRLLHLYFLYSSYGITSLVREAGTQPITGDFMLGGTDMQWIEERELHTRLHELILRGRSRITGKSYTLRTYVYGADSQSTYKGPT